MQYFFLALETFRVPNNSTDLQVRLTDNRNASIPELKLTQILKQFHRSASFFVQIDYAQEPVDGFEPPIVTPEVIFFCKFTDRNFSRNIYFFNKHFKFHR